MWYSAAGIPYEFSNLIKAIKPYVNNNGTVYIGTDTFLYKNNYIAATVICLYNPVLKRGGKYFFERKLVKKKQLPTLVQRMTFETENSINLGLKLQKFDITNIELHLDISPKNKYNGTSKFADMLTGYVKGVGFKCKIKPYAWASASIADRHSKRLGIEKFNAGNI
ncbi:MAG: hypothetical protein CXT73_07050 [Methanobacteriota archaeon]|nr:MAG: hypothetical protein CXT73_07050 [Euryarchaeota archaeon]